MTYENTIFRGFAVRAKKKRDGSTAYFCIDRHSGGYPDWSTTPQETSKDINKVLEWVENAYGESMVLPGTIEVVRVSTLVHPMDNSEVDEWIRKNALAKLSKREKEVLKTKGVDI